MVWFAVWSGLDTRGLVWLCCGAAYNMLCYVMLSSRMAESVAGIALGARVRIALVRLPPRLGGVLVEPTRERPMSLYFLLPELYVYYSTSS